jgi:hypothetical protein
MSIRTAINSYVEILMSFYFILFRNLFQCDSLLCSYIFFCFAHINFDLFMQWIIPVLFVKKSFCFTCRRRTVNVFIKRTTVMRRGKSWRHALAGTVLTTGI